MVGLGLVDGRDDRDQRAGGTTPPRAPPPLGHVSPRPVDPPEIDVLARTFDLGAELDDPSPDAAGLEQAGIVATLKHFVGYSASRAGRLHAF